jgi:hypothetical protein
MEKSPSTARRLLSDKPLLIGLGGWLVAIALDRLGMPVWLAVAALVIGTAALLVAAVQSDPVRPYLPSLDWHPPQKALVSVRRKKEKRRELRAQAAELSREIFALIEKQCAADPHDQMWSAMTRAATDGERQDARDAMTAASIQHMYATMAEYNANILGRALALYDELVRYGLYDENDREMTRWGMEHPTNPTVLEGYAAQLARIGAATD